MIKKIMPWIIVGTVLSVVIHLATVGAVPTAIMGLLKYKSRKAGIEVNTIFHAPPVTEKSRRVVRPSPDLIYSSIVYDLGNSAIRITAPIPETYWSLSIFSSDTENFYVVNDRQVGSKTIELILYSNGKKPANPGKAILVESPSESGVVILRMLIENEDKIEALQGIQRQANCEVIDNT